MPLETRLGRYRQLAALDPSPVVRLALCSALQRMPLERDDLLVRVVADNRHDCVRGLVDGEVDVLVCYTHPDLPLQLDPQRYACLDLAQDRLMPVSQPSGDGRPRHRLTADTARPTAWLSYTPDAFLGQAVARVLQQAHAPTALRAAVESALVETLRATALAGLGAAWLPESLIAGDLNSKALVRAGADDLDVHLTVTAYAPRSAVEGRVGRIWASWSPTT